MQVLLFLCKLQTFSNFYSVVLLASGVNSCKILLVVVPCEENVQENVLLMSNPTCCLFTA